jgi:molybdate transport system substrate-binding protein
MQALRKLFLLLFVSSNLSAAVPTAASKTPQQAVQLNVAAAASLQELLAQLSQQFQILHPEVQIRSNFSGSQTLAQQIRHGAQVDVFLAAASQHLDDVAAELDLQTRQVFASNELVLIAPKDSTLSLQQLQDLQQNAFNRIAICAPSVPAGFYTQQFLQKAKLLTPLQAKFVYNEHVRSTLAMVSQGQATAGFVYLTDARVAADKVKIIAHVPLDQTGPIVYEGAVLRRSQRPATAQHFLAWLTSTEAQAVIAQHGFRLPEKHIQM